MQDAAGHVQWGDEEFSDADADTITMLARVEGEWVRVRFSREALEDHGRAKCRRYAEGLLGTHRTPLQREILVKTDDVR